MHDEGNSVGVIQFYNKLRGPITKSDLKRIFYFRKLIGQTLIKCEHYKINLQTLVGLNSQEKDLVESYRKASEALATVKDN